MLLLFFVFLETCKPIALVNGYNINKAITYNI